MNSATIKTMTDDQLIERVEYLVKRERQLVECLIWHLQEIQDRKLFLQMGFTSLFECLVKHFKYSEAVAYTRISALKIIKEVPAAAQALHSGEVSLTTLSLTQSFIRKQEKETGEKVSFEQKLQFLETIKNKSTQEVKQTLAAVNPVLELPLDRVQYLTQDHAQLQITIDKSLLSKIDYLKSLISHENLNPTHNEVFHMAIDAAIEKIEKKKGIVQKSRKQTLTKLVDEEVAVDNTSNQSNQSNQSIMALENAAVEKSTQSFSVKSSRYISRDVKRFVLNRSGHQCEFVHPNGVRCNSKFQLQFDHVRAFCKGGGSELGNIQSLCRVHNRSKGAS